MAVFRFDNFILDEDNFILVRGDEQVAISPRAFDVLVLLLRNDGRVVEKQSLFDQIWKDTFVTDDALIRAVREIRLQLGDDPAKPRYVETVRKRGYRFIGSLSTGDPTPAEMAEEPGRGVGKEETATFELETPSSALQVPHKPVIYVAAAGLLLILAAVSIGLYWGRNDDKQIGSLAVMPIEGATDETGHLVDGIAEYLIDRISRNTSIEVKASSTVFRFRGQRYDPMAIRAQLSVDAVLAGRVIPRDNGLLLFLSLADGRTNNHLWSGQYEIVESNILELQRRMAADLGNFLVRGPNGHQASSDQLTADNEAYSAYLKGRYHFLSTTARADEIATEYFKRAISRDPNFALAYAGLAKVATAAAFRSEQPSIEVFVPARANAVRALELNPGLAEAQIAMANIELWHEWDAASAERRLIRAIEIEPKNEEAHFLLGVVRSLAGDWSAGRASFERSRQIDPLNLRNNAVFAQFLTFNGDPSAAIEESRRILDLDPGFYLAHLTLAQAYVELGQYEKAIESAVNAERINQRDSTPPTFVAIANARLGRNDQALDVLRKLLERSEKESITAYNIAMIFAAVGNKDKAIAALRRAIEQRDLRLVFLESEPKLRELRDDPRFEELRRLVPRFR